MVGNQLIETDIPLHLLDRHLIAVSYTHLDVYKRQILEKNQNTKRYGRFGSTYFLILSLNVRPSPPLWFAAFPLPVS